LDTMTPMAFLEFRDMLVPASGFQSRQFREIEILMGLGLEKRKAGNVKFLKDALDKLDLDHIEQCEDKVSLFDLVEKWLEQIPYFENEIGESWPEQYKAATTEMLDHEECLMRDLFKNDVPRLEHELKNHSFTRKLFNSLFNAQSHDEMVERGARRMSQRATLAAIFILLYRDEPMLNAPFQFIRGLIELDDRFINWRWRHVSSAHKQVGIRMGTGGSSGTEYLAKAAQTNHAFKDLCNLVSFLIPSSAVPPLSPEIRRRLGFAPMKENSIPSTPSEGSNL